MRLTKLRLLTLGIGLLAVALTAAGLAVPSGTAKASTTTNFLVTLYGWPDNSPPGNAIAYPADGGYPTIHNAAGGTGTYSDPVTFATDQAELPIGSIVYYPYLHRYFIMEDDCTACDEDWTGQGPDGGPGFHHIDLWANGQNGNANDAINCEDNLTQGSAPVIIDPPSNEPVDTTPLFNSSTNTCYNPSSFSGGSGPEGPYGGTPAAVPGTVQAENYDTGGQGTAYNVTSVNGSDNAYRSDGVDLEATTDTGGGNDLGWTTAGQWFKYTVNVATAGTYTVGLRLASPTAVTDGLHIANSSGTNLSGNINVPATGGYQTWTTVNATVTLPAGTQTLTVDQDNAGWNINYLTFSLNSTTGGEAPYGGTPAAVPGTVQAENYDTGGQGVGYNVTSTNGSANSYRSDGVDLEATTDTGGGDDLGWTTAGQWFKYTVNVATAGTYTVGLRLASPTAVTDGLHIANSSGTNLSGNVNVPATGGYQTWTTVNATVTLPAGRQTLTVDQDTAGWNINYLTFSLNSTTGGEAPYGGTPTAVPGTVQAENYDTGGQGVAYNVTSTNGSANSYRSDGVDLEATTDTGGGDDLGWTTTGQWFKYTVNVATAGTHTVALRLASPNAVTDGLHIASSAGTNLSGNVNVPATGGYQTWTTVNVTLTLPAGTQTLTIDQDNAGWNINYLTFS